MMLYLIVICVTAYFTHKVSKAIFLFRYENNIKFIQKSVSMVLQDDEFITLLERRQRVKRQEPRGRKIGDFEEEEDY